MTRVTDKVYVILSKLLIRICRFDNVYVENLGVMGNEDCIE